MKRTRWLLLVALIAGTIPAPARAAVTFRLTLDGPGKLTQTGEATYTGTLTMHGESDQPVPGQVIEILADTTAVKQGVTDTNGKYSIKVPLIEPKTVTLQAVAYRTDHASSAADGTPLSSFVSSFVPSQTDLFARSEPLTVSLRASARTFSAAGRAQIAAGQDHTCVLVSDGGALCWGDNGAGQLGDGTTFNRTAPVTVQGLSRATGVAAGLGHTCALIVDGTVKCWGQNSSGQLGNGTDTASLVADPVTGLSDAIAISAGAVHTCALTVAGEVKCWGHNGQGQVGDGTTANRTAPQLVTGLGTAVAVSAGGRHTCALLSNHEVRCWGSNRQGQLGDGDNVNTSSPSGPVGNLDGVVSIAAGAVHTCAAIVDGTAKCWGLNANGELGNGESQNVHFGPVPVSNLTMAVALASGVQDEVGGYTCALLANGTVDCWGHNRYGQLGSNGTTDSPVPLTVAGLSDAITISSGAKHVCAVLAGGGVRCWGENRRGQLGDGTTFAPKTPVAVSGLADVKGVAAGSAHNCAVLSDRTARCWGGNNSGNLGDGTMIDRVTPVEVTGIPLACYEERWSACVATGSHHSCLIVQDGAVRCWGWGSDGRLGDGTDDGAASPVAVDNLSTAVAISSQAGHTCALLANGEAWCWGENASGQLGDGTTIDRWDPVPVSSGEGRLTGITAVSAGAIHSCALIEDGTIRCWGKDVLGDGTTNDSSTPIPVVGVQGAVDVDAGGAHTCALIADGSVRCWGANESGQLGNGTRTSWSGRAATRVTGLPPAVHVSSGLYHSCALIADGSAWCWGGNSTGELGDGTNVDRSVPVRVEGLGEVAHISAGNSRTCALLLDGTVKCWGNQTFGGPGRNPYSTEPVAVQNIGDGPRGFSVSAGFRHTCATISNGTAKCWGSNSGGQLGNPQAASQQRTAKLVQGLTSGVEMSAGGISQSASHTCSRISDGTVACWGANSSGQVGDGTTTPRLTPASVSIGGVRALTAGGTHTCALTVGATAKCWGNNSTGQLGDQTATRRLTPASVVGLSDAAGIAAGGFHTCALRQSGAVACFGGDDFGQLGDGIDLVGTTSPVPVAGVTSAGAVSSGGSHTCALLWDATVRCWGSNELGQLGDGTFVQRPTPVTVRLGNGSPLGGVIAIDAGGSHTCALLFDGRAACWGANGDGQLGLGELSGAVPFATVLVQQLDALAISAGDSHTCVIVVDGTARCFGRNDAGQVGDGTAQDRPSPVRVVDFPEPSGLPPSCDGGGNEDGTVSKPVHEAEEAWLGATPRPIAHDVNCDVIVPVEP